MHLTTPLPIPDEALAKIQIPERIIELSEDFLGRFHRIREEGHFAPREALAGCLEILRAEQRERTFRWIPAVIARTHLPGPPLSAHPLRDWNDSRLQAFFGRLFRMSWTAETCAAANRSQWREALPECGQSCVTALVVQKYVGGIIRRGSIEGSDYGLYFLNALHGGRLLELTRGQFRPHAQVVPGWEVPRDELLEATHPHFESGHGKAANVPQRYALLHERFLFAVAGMALASSSLLAPKPD